MNIEYVKRFGHILLFTVASIVFIHLFAFAGILIAVSYPLWWFIYPNLIICFSCQTRGNGNTCGWCQRKIQQDSPRYPLGVKSLLINMALLVVAAVISMGVVYAETKLLTHFGIFSPAKTASFSLPARRQYRLMEVFPFKVEISGIDKPVNAVQVDLAFDARQLQAVNIDISDSFADIFIQRDIDNEQGFIRLSGGLPNPGFTGEKGVFATVYFQAISPGATKVEFLPTSLVMANDGKGSNLLREFAMVPFFINGEVLTSEELSAQTRVMGASVLGAQTGAQKLTFFDDDLDTSLQRRIETEESQPSVGERFLQAWRGLNTAILGFWRIKSV